MLVPFSSLLKLTSDLHFADLGCGWAPIVLDSKEELDFVGKGQNFISWIQTYWFGGSTDAQKGTTLQYSDYNTDRSGIKYFKESKFGRNSGLQLDIFFVFFS